MRILFLCGCLEPGRDGVGDYTRRLALELCQNGHQVSILSLNDNFITEPINGSHMINDNRLSYLRIPVNYARKSKLVIAKEFVKTLDLDWLSLQFVPYSFNDKGTPFWLARFLNNLTTGKKWHIMFHEMWIVDNSYLPTKNTFISYFQKRIISRLLKKLRPGVIHTQTKFYQDRLEAIGFNTGYLPLFSNIPVKTDAVGRNSNLEYNEIRFISFGSIYPNSMIKQFANDAAAYQRKHNIEISFTILGNSGHLKNDWLTILTDAGLKIYLTGEVSPEKISEILNDSSIGISSTPFVMIEKSGSVAAMREHGLPVICIAESFTPKDFIFHPMDGVIDYNGRSFEECINHKSSSNCLGTVSSVAHRLVNDFSSCTS